MALYLLKPVVWNSHGYIRPSGGKFTSGYPKENGFGHEEWNNSEYLTFVENGKRQKLFHTEPVGDQVKDHIGDIFLFLIASHEGHQYLVAVAGKATALWNESKRTRQEILNRTEFDAELFERQAWSVPQVQAAFKMNEENFSRKWKREPWLPAWRCPETFYLGLQIPVRLNAELLTGKNRFIGMYASYQQIDKSVATRIIDLIPSTENQTILQNLKTALDSAYTDAEDDIKEVERSNLSPLTKKLLVDARLGQGKFRSALDDIWGARCAVNGCDVREVLRASHIKPWRKASKNEKLDPENGLLLSANLDALFDRGLI